METSQSGVFACGNVVHVNDLVDNVSSESEQAGMYAAKYAKGELAAAEKVVVCKTGRNVRYVCPHKIAATGKEEKVTLYFRALSPEEKVKLVVKSGEEVIATKKELRVNPGEMCSVKVDVAKVYENLTVEIVKE
jgi:nitrate reductase alpha subunit